MISQLVPSLFLFRCLLHKLNHVQNIMFLFRCFSCYTYLCTRSEIMHLLTKVCAKRRGRVGIGHGKVVKSWHNEMN